MTTTTSVAYNIHGQSSSDYDASGLSETYGDFFNTAAQLSTRKSNQTDLQKDQPYSSEYSVRQWGIDIDSLIPMIPKVRPIKSTFTPLQEWEGYVVEIENETFTARLIDITAAAENEQEEADFPISELSDTDKKLLRVGAIFRWAIGYRRSYSGSKERVSRIVFRRLPAWTSRELEENRSKAKLLAATLQGE